MSRKLKRKRNYRYFIQYNMNYRLYTDKCIKYSKIMNKIFFFKKVKII